MAAIESKLSELLTQYTVNQGSKAKKAPASDSSQTKFSDLIKTAVSSKSSTKTTVSNDIETSELNASNELDTISKLDEAIKSGDIQKALDEISELPEDEQTAALTKLLQSLFGELPQDLSLLQLLLEQVSIEQLPQKLAEMLTEQQPTQQIAQVDSFNAVKQKIVDYSQLLKEQVVSDEPTAEAQPTMQIAETVETAATAQLTEQVITQVAAVTQIANAAVKPTQSKEPEQAQLNTNVEQQNEGIKLDVKVIANTEQATQGDNQLSDEQAVAQFKTVSSDGTTQKAEQDENEGFEQVLKQTQGSEQSTVTHTTESVASQVEKLVDGDSQIQGRVDLVQQLTAKISAENAKNQNEFVMQLQPKELGSLVIKMAINGNKLNVNIYAESANTQRLMQSQIADLEQSLKSQTSQIVTVNVQNEAFNQMASSDNSTNFNQSNNSGNRSGTQNNGGSYNDTEQLQQEQSNVVTIPIANSLLNKRA